VSLQRFSDSLVRDTPPPLLEVGDAYWQKYPESVFRSDDGNWRRWFHIYGPTHGRIQHDTGPIQRSAPSRLEDDRCRRRSVRRCHRHFTTQRLPLRRDYTTRDLNRMLTQHTNR